MKNNNSAKEVKVLKLKTKPKQENCKKIILRMNEEENREIK